MVCSVEYLNQLASFLKEYSSMFLAALFLLSGFFWTTAQMYSHEMRSYDYATYQRIKEWENECSPLIKNSKRDIAQMYYRSSVVFRTLAIFHNLYLMTIIFYTITSFIIHFFLPSVKALIFLIISSIFACLIVLYEYRSYRNAKFGCLLRRLIRASNRLPLFNVKKLRIDNEIWYLIKERRKKIIEGPFDLGKRERFIMEFEMIYRKPIVVFDTNIVENSKFEELKDFERKGKIELRRIPDLFQLSGGEASFPMKFPDQKDEKRFERVLSIIYQMSLKEFQNDRKRKPETTVGIERDVKNVESAIRSHADFFVTNDGKNILPRKDDIEKEFGVRVLELIDMIQYLSS